MCLLTYLPPGLQPDLRALHNGASWNRDGHGYAIVAGGDLIVRRSMDAAALIERFARERATAPAGPALFHSRFATHGELSPGNCHPFPVGGDPRTVVAHNGVLPARVHPRGGDPRSDTRICAEEYLPGLGPMSVAGNRTRLRRWMGGGNRILILTVDPRFRASAYLFNEHEGIWHEGIWYSNDDYEYPFWETDLMLEETSLGQRPPHRGCPGGCEQTSPAGCSTCGTCFTCWWTRPCRCAPAHPSTDGGAPRTG